MKVCRVCLSKDGRLYPITSNGLRSLYQQLTGVLKLEMDVEKRFPQWVCAECGLRLMSYNKLRQKSLRAHQILTNLLDIGTNITDDDINQINRLSYNLNSNLSYAVGDNMSILECKADVKNVSETQTHWQADIKVEPAQNLKPERPERDIFEDIDELANPTVVTQNTEKCDSNKNSDTESLSLDVDEEAMSSDSATSVNLLIKTLSTKKLNTKHKKVLSNIKDQVDEYVQSIKKPKSVKKSNRIKKQPKRLQRIILRKEAVSVDDVFTIQTLSLKEQVMELEKRKHYRTYTKAPFKCNYCYRGFASKTVFARHNLMHTEKFGALECKVCKRRFRNMHSYTLHTQWHRIVYQCKECDFRSSARCSVQLHNRSKHKPKSYKCPQCDVEFNATSSYWLHMRTKHASDVVCEYCGLPFLGSKGLDLHKKLKHDLDVTSQLVPVDGPACTTCNITFVSDEALSTHLRVTHKLPSTRRRTSQSYICELCGLELHSGVAYKGHFRTLHPGQTPSNFRPLPYMCDQCGAVFPYKFSLFQHSVTHEKEATFVCDHCNKKFKSKLYLRTHIVAVHLPKQHKVYPCEICGKEFSATNNRSRHMVTVHSNVRPYVCEMCGSTFKSKAEVKCHHTHVHMKVPWPRKNKKSLYLL